MPNRNEFLAVDFLFLFVPAIIDLFSRLLPCPPIICVHTMNMELLNRLMKDWGDGEAIGNVVQNLKGDIKWAQETFVAQWFFLESTSVLRISWPNLMFTLYSVKLGTKCRKRIKNRDAKVENGVVWSKRGSDLSLETSQVFVVAWRRFLVCVCVCAL